MKIWLTSGLFLLALLAPGSAAAAIAHKPATVEPCRPSISPCDVSLRVINDRDIPQKASITLAADALDPDFSSDSVFAAPVSYVSARGSISFNFSPGIYYYYKNVDSMGVPYNRSGPYLLPLPPGAEPYRAEIVSYGLGPGDEVLISRNAYTETANWNDRTLFPEKKGVRIQVPPAGRLTTVTLPSFGFPATTPQLTDSERGALGLLNDQRRQLGLSPLRAQPDLNSAADGYASWLTRQVGQPKVDFHRLRGDPENRSVDYGWPNGGLGEVIALSVKSAEQGFAVLMDSPPHRRNLLEDSYVSAGLGFASGQFVVLLAQKVDEIPNGGFGDDLGDSSLAGITEPSDYRRSFRPTVKLLRSESPRPLLIVKVNGLRSAGELMVRQGSNVKRSQSREIRIRVRPGKIRISFQAQSGSKTRSGQRIYCLKAKDKKKVLNRCR